MSKLIEFLKNIGAARTLNLLEQYPAALSIGACRQPLLNDITIKNVQDVFDALKGDKSITKLTIYDFDKENIISLLANFLEDAECYITSIGFYSNFQIDDEIKIFSQALENNNSIEEIDISFRDLKDEGLLILLQGLNRKPDLKFLGLRNLGISLKKEAGDSFNEFLKNTNLKELDIAANPIKPNELIKLLKAIREKNTINVLNLDRICISDDESVNAISSLISKGSSITDIATSLFNTNTESREKLLTSVKDNETIRACMVFDPNNISQEEMGFEQQLDEITKNNRLKIMGDVEELE